MRQFFSINHRIKTVFAAAIILLSALLLSACRGIELENKTEQVDGYTMEQAMILLANERNRYQNLYTPQVWEVEIDETGMNYGEYTIRNVKSFMEQIKTLNMLAAERGLTITSQERDEIRILSEAFFNGLSEADRDYIGCSLNDVQTVYADYFLASKLASVLTGTVNSEISDSEAKIIRVQQIVTVSEKKAKALLKKIKIDGEDFGVMARRYSESEEIDLTLQRGRDNTVYEKEAFLLDEGQISNIIEMDGTYYILKCVDGYDETATLQRKDLLQRAILNQAFQEVYEPYRVEHNIEFVDPFWKKIDFSEGADSTVSNFFDLYQNAFPEY